MNHPDMVDQFLGRLRYESNLNWYGGEFPSGSGAISFNIDLHEPEKLPETLDRARRFFADFDRYAEAAKDRAVADLLALKNDSWLDDDEGPVTAQEFKDRMSIEGLVFYPDGSVEFFHRDGDLFSGHCILIHMSAADKFEQADIAG